VCVNVPFWGSGSACCVCERVCIGESYVWNISVKCICDIYVWNVYVKSICELCMYVNVVCLCACEGVFVRESICLNFTFSSWVSETCVKHICEKQLWDIYVCQRVNVNMPFWVSGSAYMDVFVCVRVCIHVRTKTNLPWFTYAYHYICTCAYVVVYTYKYKYVYSYIYT